MTAFRYYRYSVFELDFEKRTKKYIDVDGDGLDSFTIG